MKSASRTINADEPKERTTIFLSPSLANAAKAALGVGTTTAAIEEALKRVVQHQAMDELSALLDTPDPTFVAAPRRKP